MVKAAGAVGKSRECGFSPLIRRSVDTGSCLAWGEVSCKHQMSLREAGSLREATGKKSLGWICCTSLVQEQNQQASGAGASLFFVCSWLSEVPGSNWIVFGHSLAWKGRERRMPFRKWAALLLCKSQALRVLTLLQQSRALLQAWNGVLACRWWKQHTQVGWGKPLVAERFLRSFSFVSVATSVLQVLVHVMQSPVWWRSEATLFFSSFWCYEAGNKLEWCIY